MDHFAKARLLSARLAPAITLSLFAIVLVMAWIGWIALVDRQELASLAAMGTGVSVGPAGPLQAVLLFALSLAQAAILARALFLLRGAVARIASGEPVKSGIAASIHASGRWFAGAAMAQIAALPLASIILSIDRANGFVSIGLSAAHLLALIMAGVLMLLAHLLRAAAEIDAENREII